MFIQSGSGKILLCAWMLAFAALLIALNGCARSRAATQEQVSAALAGGAGPEWKSVVSSGDSAIPMVFDEMRLNPHNVQVQYTGWRIVRDMALAGTAKPSAPYVRKVLNDDSWPTPVRLRAALMLYWFWDSPEVRKSISACQSTSGGALAYKCAQIVRSRAESPGGVNRELVARVFGKGKPAAPDAVAVAGENAIPFLFDELRTRRGANKSWLATEIVNQMLIHGVADPAAPYVRRVAADKHESARVREAAVTMLGTYINSRKVAEALAAIVDHDPSAEVRSAALSSSVHIALVEMARTKRVANEEMITLLSHAAKDSSVTVRREACKAVGNIGWTARTQYDANPGWAIDLLRECEKDSDLKVRQVASQQIHSLKKAE